MSHGHSANNLMDTNANQPSEHQGAAVDVGSGPLLGALDDIIRRLDAAEAEVYEAHTENRGYKEGPEINYMLAMARGCVRKCKKLLLK